MNAASSAFANKDIACPMRSLCGLLRSKLNRDRDGVSSGEVSPVVRPKEALVASHKLRERTLSLEDMEGRGGLRGSSSVSNGIDTDTGTYSNISVWVWEWESYFPGKLRFLYPFPYVHLSMRAIMSRHCGRLLKTAAQLR